MFLKKILYIIISIIFVGCTNSENYVITKIDLSEYKGINIDSNNILVQNSSNNKIEYPYIDHLIENNVNYYINEWINYRIAPNYLAENTIKITIKNANIKAFSLEDNNKIEDIFIYKAGIRLEVDIYMIIEIIGPNSNNLAYLDLKAFKSKELTENISLNEKDFEIQNIINDTIKDFDKLAVQKIKEVFINFVKL